MFRKLAVAVAIALPLAGFAGGSALINVAHASSPPTFNPPQGSPLIFTYTTPPIPATCSTSYPSPAPANPAAGNPYFIYDCGPYIPGGGFSGSGTLNDPSSVGIHWTGTSGSFARFLCSVPSIVSGVEYATYSSAEIDYVDSDIGNFGHISLTCTVQTPDRPGANLFAYDVSACESQSEYADFDGENPENNFYVTESSTGLATVHCNFDSYGP